MEFNDSQVNHLSDIVSLFLGGGGHVSFIAFFECGLSFNLNLSHGAGICLQSVQKRTNTAVSAHISAEAAHVKHCQHQRLDCSLHQNKHSDGLRFKG